MVGVLDRALDVDQEIHKWFCMSLCISALQFSGTLAWAIGEIHIIIESQNDLGPLKVI